MCSTCSTVEQDFHEKNEMIGSPFLLSTIRVATDVFVRFRITKLSFSWIKYVTGIRQYGSFISIKLIVKKIRIPLVYESMGPLRESTSSFI